MEFKICNKCNEEKPNTNEYFAFSEERLQNIYKYQEYMKSKFSLK